MVKDKVKVKAMVKAKVKVEAMVKIKVKAMAEEAHCIFLIF
jgi:hypothetical protein